MMEISTLGTKICDDAIHYSHGRIINRNRFVEISPFTLSDEYSFTSTDNVIPAIDVNEPNLYFKDIFLKELNGNIVKELISSSAEYIVIDLLICRLYFKEFIFENGRVFRITFNNTCQTNIDALRKYLCEKTGSSIISERIINPINLNDDELKSEIMTFINVIKKNFKNKKIILLNARAAYHYLNKNMEVLLIDNINNCATTNSFIKKCTDIFTGLYSCPQIEMPENLICDTRLKIQLCFHYSYFYYDYINECLLSIFQNKYTDAKKTALLRQYEIRQMADIEDGSMKVLANQTFIRYKDRKIVLIGDCLSYEYWLKKTYGITVDKRVQYNSQSTYESVYEELTSIKYQYKDYFCVVPHIYQETNVLKAISKCGFALQSDCITAIHNPYSLRNFVGEYHDCYNNTVTAKSPVTLELKGSAINVSIGNNPDYKKEHLRFLMLNESTFIIGERTSAATSRLITSTVYDGGKVIIGNNVDMGNNVHIRCSFFNTTTIGDNSVIGNDTIIFNGDGHAILSVETGDNINYDLNNSPEKKHHITIGANTHIGDDCFILAGTSIADNSVIRDKSLVNKSFDVAAFIAGHPAHLVKQL